MINNKSPTFLSILNLASTDAASYCGFSCSSQSNHEAALLGLFQGIKLTLGVLNTLDELTDVCALH